MPRTKKSTVSGKDWMHDFSNQESSPEDEIRNLVKIEFGGEHKFNDKYLRGRQKDTAIDDDLEAYVAGLAELESSFPESEAEGDLCEESAAQGFEHLQSPSSDYESDSELSNDQKDKMILKDYDFVAYTCLTNTFYLGCFVLGGSEVAEEQVAVIYATARPNNMFDFNKKKTDVIKKQQIL
eukprot:gene9905-18503_t